MDLDSRVLIYNVVARRRHKLPVWSAVFLLRPEAAAASITGRVIDRLDPLSGIDCACLMGLKYQEQITETLMQSIAELEDSVEWQKIFKKGSAEGEARGKAAGERSLLIRQGTARFGAPPAAILKQFESISGEQQLQDISLRILNAASWEALLH